MATLLAMLFHQSWAVNAAKCLGANIIVGALLTAIVGALCVGAAGALFGWILDIRSTPPSWDSGFLLPGAWLGAYLGSYSGFVGLFAGGVAALDARPEASIAPPSALMRNIALGQLFGAMSAVSFYLLLTLAIAHLNGDSFVGTVEDNLELAIYGVPILTTCGAIVGALWKRDSAPNALSVN